MSWEYLRPAPRKVSFRRLELSPLPMMSCPARIPIRAVSRLATRTQPLYLIRSIHTTGAKAANVAPVLGTGPPPEAPVTPVSPGYQRVERKKRQAELLKNAKEIRAGHNSKSKTLKRRFWTDVSVSEVDGSLQVYLDQRPLRHPETKEIIQVPLSKPHLATAVALEWDHLTSSQEATKQHLIPLTSLVCRALDIQADDANGGPEISKIRTVIANTFIRYLDTDAILCWAPPAGPYDIKNDAGESLRDVQKKAADEICAFLGTKVWPGVTIKPVLDGDSIVPQPQDKGVREVVQGWIQGLDAWEIAGLERAVLAGKSVVTAARLVAEWSEGSTGVGALEGGERFDAQKAAEVTSAEVDWQASQWGEVEDTYDVNKEDVMRQLSSVILLVSGTEKP